MRRRVLGIFSTLALSALLFTACNNEDVPSPAISNGYVTIQPTVSGEVITKAGSSYGQAGDKLYLYYKEANTTADQFADFRHDGTIWDLGTNKMKWSVLHAAETGDNISFYATAPFQAPTAATKVETDQSTAANYKKSDLLVAYKSVAKGATNDKYTALVIDLKHVLAKLTIEVNAKAIENAVIKSVTIKDAVVDYKVDYKGSENEPAKTAVQGSDKVDVKPLVNGVTFSSVLPAQAIKKTDGITILIAVNDQTFTYQPTEAITLLQGKNTTLKLRLAGTGVILGDVLVSEWGEGDTKEDNIEADPDI